MKRFLPFLPLLLMGCTGSPTANTEPGSGLENGSIVVNAVTPNVRINEVAWGGTAANTGHEWIELYNPRTTAVNITGWKLGNTSSEETLTGSIPAGGYFLLERSEAATSVMADHLYSFSLSNSGGQVYLLDAAGTVVSKTGDPGAWPAGSGSPDYLSMERNSSGWHDNNGITRNGTDANGNPINGTPKRANSTPPTPPPTPRPTPTPAIPQPGDVVINEVVTDPVLDRNSDGSVTTSDEFVELLVRRDNLDLSGWLLRMNDSSPDFQEPKGIYLGRGSYNLTKAGDYILILNPTGMMDDALTIQLQTPSNAVINAVTLGSGSVPNGSSTNRLNEAVARNPNGSGPWAKQQETAGMNNTDFARIRPGVE